MADQVVADYALTGEVIIVRVDRTMSDEDAALLEKKVRELVSEHGQGFAVVVVRAVDRAKCAGFARQRAEPRRFPYPVC
jgi:hypothetical protein